MSNEGRRLLISQSPVQSSGCQCARFFARSDPALAPATARRRWSAAAGPSFINDAANSISALDPVILMAFCTSAYPSTPFGSSRRVHLARSPFESMSHL